MLIFTYVCCLFNDCVLFQNLRVELRTITKNSGIFLMLHRLACNLTHPKHSNEWKAFTINNWYILQEFLTYVPSKRRYMLVVPYVAPYPIRPKPLTQT